MVVYGAAPPLLNYTVNQKKHAKMFIDVQSTKPDWLW